MTDLEKRQVKEFLEEIYDHTKETTRDKMHLIFDNINQMLCEGRFELCDNILKEIDVERLNTRLGLTFLTITFAAFHELKERSGYYYRIYERIEFLEGKSKAKEILENLNSR